MSRRKWQWATSVLALTAWVTTGMSSCLKRPAVERDMGATTLEDSYYVNGKPIARRSEDPLGQMKKRVLVLNLWNDSRIPSKEIGTQTSQEIRRLLADTGQVLLPEEEEGAEASHSGDTVDFIQGDRVKVAQLVRYARRRGVSLVVIGRVTDPVFRTKGENIGLLRQAQSYAAVTVELKLFDVTGGRELLALQNLGEATNNAFLLVDKDSVKGIEFKEQMVKEAARKALPPLVPEIVKTAEKLTWEGRIAKLVGNRVYLNSGRSSGLVPGDILRVMTEGEDIYDPPTGAYLGSSEGALKGTLEVFDFVGDDAAIAKPHTGGNFREGDRVRLY